MHTHTHTYIYIYISYVCVDQSIGHPHPKPIKLQQVGWPLLSMCICCSGVMTTPVVSGCHWGPNGFHMPPRDIQLVDTSCHRGLLISAMTSNGSWCMGIKGEMSGTVCVTFTWYMYIYIWVVYSFCLFCCLFIIVTTQFVALYKPCKPKPKFR